MAPSKVPIYPRPVSPLSAASFDPEPKDDASGPFSEDDSDARAAKRRRIEKLGEQYLRGDGLYILSAALKGPFNSAWQNPWAKPRRTKRTAAEIPETDKPTKKRQVQKSTPVKAGNSRVEDWLRKNNNGCKEMEIEDHTSPTPKSKKSTGIQHTTATTPASKLAADATYGPSTEPNLNAVKHTILELPSPLQHSPATISILAPAMDGAARHESMAPPIKARRAWVSHAANTDRAEFAALQSKRRIGEVGPISTVLSPFQYKFVSDDAQKPRHGETAVNEETAKRKQDQNTSMAPPAIHPLCSPSATKVAEGSGKFERLQETGGTGNGPQVVAASTCSAVAVLSTETSHASIANLPSAQPQSLNVPAPSTNNLTFEDSAPEPGSQLVNAVFELPPDVEDREGKTTVTSTPTTSQADKLNWREDQTPIPEHTISSGAAKGRVTATGASEKPCLNTQEMLAAISPLTFSTIKKVTDGFQQPNTPLTATKRRSEKVSKSASFVPGDRLSSGSSQGSLKNSLRVSKGGLSIAAGKENRLDGAGEEEETNGFVSSGITAFPKESLPRNTGSQVLKSALKRAGTSVAAPHPPSTRESTSTGIDGGQNIPVIEDNGFDLNDAMDDLGSFLGPWNPEEEAFRLCTEP